jgi:hypothetical protein
VCVEGFVPWGSLYLLGLGLFLLFLFPLIQKPNSNLESDYQSLVIKNITTLPVNMLLSTTRPFFICETDKSLLPATPKVTWQGASVKRKGIKICCLISVQKRKYKRNQETNRKKIQIITNNNQ